MRDCAAVSLKEIWRRLAKQRAQESRPTAPSCDVLLLVAIDAEMDALRTACADLGIAMQPKQWDPLGNYFDLGIIGSDRVFAAQTSGDLWLTSTNTFRLKTTMVGLTTRGFVTGISSRNPAPAFNSRSDANDEAWMSAVQSSTSLS